MPASPCKVHVLYVTYFKVALIMAEVSLFYGCNHWETGRYFFAEYIGILGKMSNNNHRNPIGLPLSN
jgi:hypothetical protein